MTTTSTVSTFQAQVLAGIPALLPAMPAEEPGISHAPDRPLTLMVFDHLSPKLSKT